MSNKTPSSDFELTVVLIGIASMLLVAVLLLASVSHRTSNRTCKKEPRPRSLCSISKRARRWRRKSSLKLASKHRLFFCQSLNAKRGADHAIQESILIPPPRDYQAERPAPAKMSAPSATEPASSSTKRRVSRPTSLANAATERVKSSRGLVRQHSVLVNAIAFEICIMLIMGTKTIG